MLLFFLLSYYLSFDDYQIRCTICKSLLNKSGKELEKVQKELETLKTEDEMVNFLNQIIKSILNTKKNKEQLCANKIGCQYNLPDGYFGQRCRTCLNAAEYLARFAIEKQKKALYKYCETFNTAVSSFCGDVIEEGFDSFINNINSKNNSLKTCENEYFCRKKNDDL